MDTYKTSDGKLVKIAEMNPYHLANAIKKLSANYKRENAETLSALRAEQERRGGPPQPKPDDTARGPIDGE
jgi:hypothetical protein